MQRKKTSGAKNFVDHEDEDVGVESMRDSLESSDVSSEAFPNRFKNGNNFNQITQYIQNNNNKITIIIKHDGNSEESQLSQASNQNVAPKIIYIQPASSQPNLHPNHNSSNEIVYNSLDDLESDEHYQFYNEKAIDVPDEFKRNSYLVLNFNDAANRRLKRRICTPTRNLLPPIEDDGDFMMKSRESLAVKNWNDNENFLKSGAIKVSCLATQFLTIKVSINF